MLDWDALACRPAAADHIRPEKAVMGPAQGVPANHKEGGRTLFGP